MKAIKILLVTLFFGLFTYTVSAQHYYLTVVRGIETVDSAKYVCDAFSALGVSDCNYSEINKYFKLKTKNLLPRIIVEDYFSALGYYIVLHIEVEEKPQLWKMPVKKDTIMAN
jgi:hypothetical protein